MDEFANNTEIDGSISARGFECSQVVRICAHYWENKIE